MFLCSSRATNITLLEANHLHVFGGGNPVRNQKDNKGRLNGFELALDELVHYAVDHLRNLRLLIFSYIK